MNCAIPIPTRRPMPIWPWTWMPCCIRPIWPCWTWSEPGVGGLGIAP